MERCGNWKTEKHNVEFDEKKKQETKQNSVFKGEIASVTQESKTKQTLQTDLNKIKFNTAVDDVDDVRFCPCL